MRWVLTWEEFQELDTLIGVLRTMRGMGGGVATVIELNLQVEWTIDGVAFILPADKEV